MNYAVELSGCAQLEARELERISLKFREILELRLGGQDRVRLYLDAFLRVTDAVPGYQLSEVDFEHATAYAASHQTAELVALDGCHHSGAITVLIRLAH